MTEEENIAYPEYGNELNVSTRIGKDATEKLWSVTLFTVPPFWGAHSSFCYARIGEQFRITSVQDISEIPDLTRHSEMADAVFVMGESAYVSAITASTPEPLDSFKAELLGIR